MKNANILCFLVLVASGAKWCEGLYFRDPFWHHLGDFGRHFGFVSIMFISAASVVQVKTRSAHMNLCLRMVLEWLGARIRFGTNLVVKQRQGIPTMFLMFAVNSFRVKRC